MVVHQVVSETTPYQIQKKFYILGKFLLRKSYLKIKITAAKNTLKKTS